MKKSPIIAIVIVILIIVGIVWYGRSGSSPQGATNQPTNGGNFASTAPVPVVETTKVSSKLSKYENDELGFTINYPTGWESTNTNTGVSFIMPIDQNQVSTVAKLQADINIISGKCSFPPVTTIKDRGTLSVAGVTANMISMTNTVQGRSYFNRMYSLQKGEICYIFSFSSIALAPETKNLTGSNRTQAENNNKAIVNTADTDFSNMVKSFLFVIPPVGQDESKATPVKK
ncbi:MAG: hypothetical protein WCT02_04705 [Candidatus Paceibacterota bacterium]|jgi:hypothetical protein